jgi:hypothetical protein
MKGFQLINADIAYNTKNKACQILKLIEELSQQIQLEDVTETQTGVYCITPTNKFVLMLVALGELIKNENIPIGYSNPSLVMAGLQKFVDSKEITSEYYTYKYSVVMISEKDYTFSITAVQARK